MADNDSKAKPFFLRLIEGPPLTIAEWDRLNAVTEEVRSLREALRDERGEKYIAALEDENAHLQEQVEAIRECFLQGIAEWKRRAS